MLILDGSLGEGGGQILRSALALSMVTGKPFKIHRIRAGRNKPGLMRQHLTSVEAAAQVSGAEVAGGVLGSTELTFVPQSVRGGTYHFRIGTAGSTTLVLQTVLLPLALCGAPSHVTLEGGTHNPHAPPFDFLNRVYLPLLGRMGPIIDVALERPGFFPAGGGRLVAQINPAGPLRGLTLIERGEVTLKQARVLVSQLPRHIAEREIRVLSKRLRWPPEDCVVQEILNALGPGNVVMIEIGGEHFSELFTSFGEVGRRAEAVAEEAAGQVVRYLDSGVPVGEYLTDQLLLPLALAGRGGFRTAGLSGHAQTQRHMIRAFLEVEFLTEAHVNGGILVWVGERPG